jgi:hypothetical protein
MDGHSLGEEARMMQESPSIHRQETGLAIFVLEKISLI